MSTTTTTQHPQATTCSPKARHTVATRTAAGALGCDCGQEVSDRRAWSEHTATTYNRPSPSAVRARLAADWEYLHPVVRVTPAAAYTVAPCTKVACYNAGNGRGCWTLTRPAADPHARVLHDLPSQDAAEQLARFGGLVAQVHLYSTC